MGQAEITQDLLDQAYAVQAEIFKNTFSSDQGKKAMNILSMKFYAQPCFDDKNPDPYLAAKRDGQRSVLQYIYDEIARAQ